MNLHKIVAKLKVESFTGNFEQEIKDVCYDSRTARENSLFVALPGFRLDGHQFISEAFSRGARAFLVEKDIPPLPGTVVLKVSSTRKTLAEISNIFYEHPSLKLKVIGVTGTKGKTTVTYFLQSIFRQAGVKVGRLSTINYDLNGEIIPAVTTTPESLDLQKFLRKMVDSQVQYVFMEVSSHSLVLHRVEGTEFSWAIFTNLAPEHLDFHRNMEDYLKAKLVLFEAMLPQKKALVNVDDCSSRKIIERTPCSVITYGIRNEADFRASNIRAEKRKVIFEVQVEGRRSEFIIHIPGMHNVYNALAAIAVAIREKIPLPMIKEGLASVREIPGRLEFIENRANLNIYVDYAHTPSSLEQVLGTLRELASGRVVVVFGCGGDRDPYKRPIMGRIAANMADFIVVTSDNPRSERPENIIADIEQGMREAGAKKGRDYVVLADRKEAIAHALANLSTDDTLLVAGKGHEQIQIFKDKTVSFDDRIVIRELLRKSDLL